MCAINALACDELLKQKRFVKNKKQQHIYAKNGKKEEREEGEKSQIQNGLPE
jgi:hypothetical protein